jgi:hypothetical protein
MANIFKPLSELKVNHQICPSFRLHQILNGAIPKTKKAVLFIPFEAVSGNPAA